MRHLARATITGVFLLPLLSAGALAQSEDLAFDFRTTDSVTARGQTVQEISTGHGVFSKGRVRLDIKGNSKSMRMPGMVPGGEMSMILMDGGKTLVFLQPRLKKFLILKPFEVMGGAQKLMEGLGGSMSFDVSGDDPKVENLGSGPVILGHKTLHYRITMNIKVSVSAMGQSQTVDRSSTSDEYLAPDLGGFGSSFEEMGASGFGPSAMGSMFGPGGKPLLEKLKAARAKLPKAAELRSETRAVVTTAGGTTITKSLHETTAIRKIKASSDLFEVPAGYTKMNMPMIQPGGAPIPPSRN